MTSPQASAAPRRYLRHGLIPQLAAFEAVMRLGSAAQAADSLCIAQPTLSGQLRKLSETLGVRLFELRGKRLVPTPAARTLVATVGEVFDAFSRCDRALAPMRGAHRVSWRERTDNAGPWLHPVP